MTNDLINLSTTVSNIVDNVTELAELGQDGFNVPLVTTSDELADMAELPLKPRRSLSNDLIWFYALKITSCAREMLLESARIFQQVDDEEIAGQVEQVLDVLDEQINPGETAFKTYQKLLQRPNFYDNRPDAW